MAYFFIKARNIHHTLHMGLQSVRHHVTTGSGHFVTVTKYPDPDVTHVLNPQAVNLAYDVLAPNIFMEDGKLLGLKIYPSQQA